MCGCQASVYTPNHITDPHITDKSFYPIYHAGHDPFHYAGKKDTADSTWGPCSIYKAYMSHSGRMAAKDKGILRVFLKNCKNSSNSSRYSISLDNYFFNNKCIQYSLLKIFCCCCCCSLIPRGGASAIWRTEAIEQATGSLQFTRGVVTVQRFFLYVWLTATAKMSERKVLNVSIWTLKFVLHCCY